jgi:hypothetical protein
VRISAASQEPAEPQVATKFEFFLRHSEQLIGREARRELEEASAHILGAKASPEAALTITNQRSSRLTVAGLHCCPLSIKVSLIKFPSSLWSRRSKPHQKPTTVAQNLKSDELPRLAVVHHREREPAPPPAGASRPNRLIGDERPRLEVEITLHGDRSWTQIAESTSGV